MACWDHYHGSRSWSMGQRTGLHHQADLGKGRVRRLRVRLQSRQQHPAVPGPAQDRERGRQALSSNSASSSPTLAARRRSGSGLGGRPASLACREYPFPAGDRTSAWQRFRQAFAKEATVRCREGYVRAPSASTNDSRPSLPPSVNSSTASPPKATATGTLPSCSTA